MVAPLVKQTWISSGVILNVFSQGMVLGYSSCLLPGLAAKDSTIKIDGETGSWLASSMGFTSMLGALISSYAMDRWGRRATYAAMISPSLVSWVIIYFAGNITILMIGRIITGLSIGSTILLGAVAIGEYTSPENRGIFLNIKTVGVYLGATILHIISNYYHWRTVALLCAIPGLLGLLITLTWPESPSWLAGKNQFQKSEENFYWIRGYTEKSIREFEAMVQAQKGRIAPEIRTSSHAVKEYFRKIRRKDFLKPLIIVSVAHILLECCGRHTFSAYASDIIKTIAPGVNSFASTFYIDILATSSATFSCVLVKRIKRRKLLFFSGLTTITMAILLASYLCLVDNQIISSERTYIPITILASMFIFANLGCSPIPLMLAGELYPLPYRAMSSGVTGVTTGLSLILALKLWPTLVASVDLSGTFAVSAAVTAVCIIYLYFTLPETKDRTLQEIEDFFNYGQFVDDDVEVMVKMKKDDEKDDIKIEI